MGREVREVNLYKCNVYMFFITSSVTLVQTVLWLTKAQLLCLLCKMSVAMNFSVPFNYSLQFMEDTDAMSTDVNSGAYETGTNLLPFCPTYH